MFGKLGYSGLAGAAIAVVLVSGCGTTSGYEKADKTGSSMAEFRQDMINGKKAIDATMDSLGQIAITANTDPRPAFEQYANNVKALEAAADKAGKRSQSIQQMGMEYFKQWEAQLAEVQNASIRQVAEQRKAQLQETFGRIKTTAEPLKAQFGPWLSDLKDLRTVLANDLTITGVESVKPLFVKTRAEGAEVQKSMDALIDELNTVAATLTPAKK